MQAVRKQVLPEQSELWSLFTPGDFVDGYSVQSDLAPFDAMKIGLNMPGWVKILMGIRNAIVAPFGLKGGKHLNTDNGSPDAGTGAIFPVTYRDETEVIVGIDDRHLDFRIAVHRDKDRVVMATWVRTHNRLGRIYLTVIMPLHILIVRNCMKRIARASQV
ncbi:DUF2867 domain-containing protein [Ruegeria arenilitoris]|uniref:DUF2867 domain-containing protein n=1 Tax=Ruegeria arenilitoris TaxID=1173585 RepID=UPI00147E7B75|nr:DUF2867 domain-containing protein [Ruegeria arenilitoris]